MGADDMDGLAQGAGCRSAVTSVPLPVPCPPLLAEAATGESNPDHAPDPAAKDPGWVEACGIRTRTASLLT